jgi:hypothetical protein
MDTKLILEGLKLYNSKYKSEKEDYVFNIGIEARERGFLNKKEFLVIAK